MKEKWSLLIKNIDDSKKLEETEIEKPHLLSATQIIKEIANGKLSATTLVKSYYKQYQKLENSVNAWTHYNFKNSLLQANIIDEGLAKKKKFIGNLAGIPIGIKDIFNTSDYPTGMGSMAWSGFELGNDARCVNSLKLDGAIILGKTVTAEFCDRRSWSNKKSI